MLECLASIFETVKNMTFEVWFVDNASVDGSVESVKNNYPDINIIENERNLGFAAANNIALKRMNGRYALLLNTDATLTESAVDELYSFMEDNHKTGIACGQLLNMDGSKQNSIANFPSLLSLLCNETVLRILFPNKFPSKREEYTTPLEVDSCIGACMIVRKEAMDEVGIFDEGYFFYLEETDWAYRMKQAGWKVFFVPTARIFHAQGKSVGKSANKKIMFYRSRYYFFKKWHESTYIVIYTAVFFRLLANTILSLLGVLFTLGLNGGIRKRFNIYIQLIFWHSRVCPLNL
ncbi:MAG: glycosyltransferase family 2 protein [Desulfobacterales bacterium]|nr:glycosyltransferase family 2 protein [Desulfobacterales bacterium]